MSHSYELFQDDWCPFCARVTRFMKESGIDIPLRNTMRDRNAHEELVRRGGRATVPCLHISDESGYDEWLYESSDIIKRLARDMSVN